VEQTVEDIDATIALVREAVRSQVDAGMG
jgi:hypothetical protein